MEVIMSTFEDIYPVWNEKLWPGRISKIEPMSNLYWRAPRDIIKDNTIFDKYTPTFFLIKEDSFSIALATNKSSSPKNQIKSPLAINDALSKFNAKPKFFLFLLNLIFNFFL